LFGSDSEPYPANDSSSNKNVGIFVVEQNDQIVKGTAAVFKEQMKKGRWQGKHGQFYANVEYVHMVDELDRVYGLIDRYGEGKSEA